MCYECDKINVSVNNFVSNGYNLLFYITVKPKTMTASPMGPVAVGNTVSVWCMSDTSYPQVNIRWKGSRIPILAESVTSTSSAAAFHGKTVNSSVVLLAKKTWNRRILTCTPEFNGALLMDKFVHFMLNITSKFNLLMYILYTFVHDAMLSVVR